MSIRYPLLVVACLLLSVAYTLKTGDSVHAASPYDNNLQMVTTMGIMNSKTGQPETVVDDHALGVMIGQKCTTQQVTDFTAALQSPNAYAISVSDTYEYSSGNLWRHSKMIYVQYDVSGTPKPFNFTFSPPYVYPDTNNNTKGFFLHQGDGGTITCDDTGGVSPVSTSTINTEDGNPQLGLYVSSFPWVAPDGYTGAVPVNPNVEPLPIVRPNILVDVNNKDVIIRSKANPKLDGTKYKIYWLITNANVDGTGPANPFTLTGTSDPEQTLTFTVPDNGTYNIDAYYQDENGNSLPSTADYQIKDTSINVNIDGSTFTLDTDKYTCNGNNYCAAAPIAPWVDETCDLLHMKGCIDNGVHYLLEWLGITKTDSNPTGSPFIAFQSNTHGVTSIITAPLAVLTNLSQSTYGCNSINMPMPYINKNLTLPCLTPIYTNNFGGFFAIYQTIITGIVTYYIMVRILQMVKNIKDPQKDQIEVLEL